eukprot:TRINITY_DN12421_c0_g2_i4.p3 TRINITY_DN12421_c0_g2~~TRINITY_DN12421_c0_g2_i4.p3  ORF type:complete len:113 (+),score=52.49 TRINITY_DN12421_c0_g2_i4:121-459(+)
MQQDREEGFHRAVSSPFPSPSPSYAPANQPPAVQQVSYGAVPYGNPNPNPNFNSNPPYSGTYASGPFYPAPANQFQANNAGMTPHAAEKQDEESAALEDVSIDANYRPNHQL